MKEMIQNIIDIESKTYNQEQLYMLTALKVSAIMLLKLEKEQIIDAVNVTEQEAVDFCNKEVKYYYDHEGMFGVVPDAGINYYNEKFKDND